MKNEIEVSGEIVEQRYVIPKNGKEPYYAGILESKRHSGVVDRVPFISRKELHDDSHIIGKVVTTNTIDDTGKMHKRMFVKVNKAFPKSIVINRVALDGYIVHKDQLRETPAGKLIIDFVIAVNTLSGSYYISCIAWNDLASRINNLPLNGRINIIGRFQSRNYTKSIVSGDETGYVHKTAYEISVCHVDTMEDQQYDS